MKKKIIDFCRKNNCEVRYSGNSETYYLHGDNSYAVLQLLIRNFDVTKLKIECE